MPAHLPVSMVVLYSSGVAYFEHAGEVNGNTVVELGFKAAQINDVLKSLVLQDMGGGTIGAVVYPSHDPIARTLKSFQVDLTENPPLPALLNQLRGAGLTVQLSTEAVTGTIVGVEKRPKALERGSMEIWVLNLLVGGAIRTMPLENITALTLQDAQLQKDLSDALGVVAKARDQDKKPASITFNGEGARRVRVGYVVEAPIWKSTYRLILPEEGATEPAHMQGWAIVENQTDNDWPLITLTLVSGRPISFIQDLYQPLFLERPTVQPNLYASVRPQMYGAGVAAASVMEEAMGGGAGPASGGATIARRRAQAMKVVGLGGSSASVMDHLSEEMDPTASVASQAAAKELGELFQFTVQNVALPRQRSAMIPIVTDPIEFERLSIYNQRVLGSNPLYAVKLINTTGKHLLQGPVTVLEDSAYAGDAQIDNLPPGQNRFLSYGIDLQMIVKPKGKPARSVIQSGRISGGVLELEEKHIATMEYTVENKSPKAKRLLIEHPIERKHKLSSKPEPIESTATHYRLRYELAAGEVRTITVQEECMTTSRVALMDELAATMEKFVRSDGIAADVKAGLEELIKRRRALNDLDVQMNAIEKQIAELTKEQGRIRDNLKSAPDSSQYHNRLLAKLNEQESLFETLQTELEALRAAREKGRKEMADYLAELDLG